MPGLPIIVLLDGELPARIVMRMRHHNDLQFLRIPLVSSIGHLPTLLPSTAVHIPELNLVVQALGRDIHGGSGVATRNGLPVARFSRLGYSGCVAGSESGGDRRGDAVAEDDEEEEEEGDEKADREEVLEEEVL